MFIKNITDTAFKQQRLPAWQPILTARNVMPIFFALAAAFIPIGLGLLYLTKLVSKSRCNHIANVLYNDITHYL